MFKTRKTRMAGAVVLVITATLITLSAIKAPTSAIVGVYTESKEQALREFQLGERYGEFPPHAAQFSAEQISSEYLLGERYGVTPQEYAKQQALREYSLGERSRAADTARWNAMVEYYRLMNLATP